MKDQEKPYVDECIRASDVFTNGKYSENDSENEFRGLFGAEDNIRIIGKDEDDVPAELIETLRGLGFGDAGEGEDGRRKNKFRLMLKQMFPESNGDPRKGKYIKQFRYREIPTVQHIATEYGAGEYCLQIQYDYQNPETLKRKTEFSYIPFSISEKVEPERRKLLREKKMQEIKDAKERLRQLREDEYFEDELGFGDKAKDKVDPMEAGKQYMESIMKANQMLGISPGARGGTNWGEVIPKVLGLVAPALPSIIGMLSERSRQERERMDKFMMMMISQKDSSHNQMIELLQKNSSGSNNIMEAMDMVARMVDFKKELSEEKESVLDKIMGMVETAAPILGPLLALPAQARRNNPLYKQAQNFMEHNPEVQAAKNDPEIIQRMVQNLDAKFDGDTSKTDAFLEAAGVSRPANMSGYSEETPDEYADAEPINPEETDTDE